MTEHETTASLRRAAPLRWWTFLWAGALWMAAAVLLVSVAFGCSAGAETDDGQTDDGAEASGAEPEAGQDNAPAQTPAAPAPSGPADPDRCAEAQAEAERLAPGVLDAYDGGETTLASREWRGLASAVLRAINGGGPGCSSGEGSAARAVRDLARREDHARETARLEALEARRAEDAEDQAAAEAAVERAWQEAGGGALSGGAGALSEPDPGETTDPGPDSNPDRPGCQTEANPVVCFPPPVVEGEPDGEIDGETDPGPDPEADPEPEVQVDPDPETPQSIIEFEDKAADVDRPAQTTRRQPDGPVLLTEAAALWTMADLLCPPEDVWRSFYTGCGDPAAEGDYLRGHGEMLRCFYGPVEIGVGDSYRLLTEEANPEWDPEVSYYRNDAVLEVLGFSALDPADPERWQPVQPEISARTVQRFEYHDGAVDEETYTAVYKPPSAWWQLGGADHRGHNPDGSLAWGLFAIPGGSGC